VKITKLLFCLVFILTACLLVSCRGDGSDATADWEVYENHALGYSIKYPAGCTFGPMPSNCKGYPPEDRPPECLCFLDSANPNEVFMQAFLEKPDGELTLASLAIVQFHPDAHNPPEGTDLVSYLGEHFPELPGEIPSEPNAEVGGVSAVRVYTPGSPQAFSYEEIYFVRDGKLFVIRLHDVDSQENRELYDNMLSTMQFE